MQSVDPIEFDSVEPDPEPINFLDLDWDWSKVDLSEYDCSEFYWGESVDPRELYSSESGDPSESVSYEFDSDEFEFDWDEFEFASSESVDLSELDWSESDSSESVDPSELDSEEEKTYIDRLYSYQEETGLTEAVQTGTGQLNGISLAMGVMDFRFIGGSMGSAVGEKITRLIEYAAKNSLPLILVCASGGARMPRQIHGLYI